MKLGPISMKNNVYRDLLFLQIKRRFFRNNLAHFTRFMPKTSVKTERTLMVQMFNSQAISLTLKWWFSSTKFLIWLILLLFVVDLIKADLLQLHHCFWTIYTTHNCISNIGVSANTLFNIFANLTQKKIVFAAPNFKQIPCSIILPWQICRALLRLTVD